jgi:hypothetical protein
MTLQLADNDMLVDEYEQYNNDRTDVVVVSRSGSEEEPETEPLADDCTSAAFLPCQLYHCWVFLLLYDNTLVAAWSTSRQRPCCRHSFSGVNEIN